MTSSASPSLACLAGELARSNAQLLEDETAQTDTGENHPAGGEVSGSECPAEIRFVREQMSESQLMARASAVARRYENTLLTAELNTMAQNMARCYLVHRNSLQPARCALRHPVPLRTRRPAGHGPCTTCTPAHTPPHTACIQRSRSSFPRTWCARRVQAPAMFIKVMLLPLVFSLCNGMTFWAWVCRVFSSS